MTPQERDVIAGIFDRLKQAANQPRDPEAEAFIAERLREQPYAPYAMAQSVYVQEQALTNLHQQVESLQAQLRELQNRAPEPAPAAGGFLSGIFGGAPAQPRGGSVPPIPQRADAQPSSAWNTQPAAAPQPMGQPQYGAAPSPWSGQPQQPAARGGGFMASALTTAAGVAGGMMLGNVLSNAFSGGSGAASSLANSVGGFGSGAKTAASDQGAKDQAADAKGADDPARVDQASDTPGGEQNPALEQANYDQGYDDSDAGFDSGSDDDSWV